MKNRKPVEERADVNAYQKFNNEKLQESKNYMVENFGEDWLYKNPDEMNLSLVDCGHAATVFCIGYDQISVNDESSRPMISDWRLSYEIKKKWLAYLNKKISDSLDLKFPMSKVFIDLYTSLDKDRWNGMEQYKILNHGVDRGNLIMSALKNTCLFSHINGRSLTYDLAKIVDSVFHNHFYWTFDDRIKVIYDDNLTEKYIYGVLQDEFIIANRFVTNMLTGKFHDAYQDIKAEVEKRFPKENPNYIGG